MSVTKGGKKKEISNLQLRRKKWDAMSVEAQKASKRPGSNKK